MTNNKEQLLRHKSPQFVAYVQKYEVHGLQVLI